MDLLLIKQSIYSKVNEIENQQVLEYISSTIDDATGNGKPKTVDGLTETETKSMFKAIRQEDAGIGIPHDQVMKKLKSTFKHGAGSSLDAGSSG
ncbi:hypothetical protein [Parasediminibacterium sp. JCM 36343]|uniref:hypothetical protein n=1 Tax=Parasediminibacterium sp. JCM 36343 TaxID=3374279 RepID=UPI00397E66D7